MIGFDGDGWRCGDPHSGALGESAESCPAEGIVPLSPRQSADVTTLIRQQCNDSPGHLPGINHLASRTRSHMLCHVDPTGQHQLQIVFDVNLSLHSAHDPRTGGKVSNVRRLPAGGITVSTRLTNKEIAPIEAIRSSTALSLKEPASDMNTNGDKITASLTSAERSESREFPTGMTRRPRRPLPSVCPSRRTKRKPSVPT